MYPTSLQVEGGEPVGIGLAPQVVVGNHVQAPDAQGMIQRWAITAIDWARNDIGAWVQVLTVEAVGAADAVPGNPS